MGGKKARILLIDDDVDFVEITKSQLEQSGYEVAVAYTAQEGSEYVTGGTRPDLIILDLIMEKHDSGFTLCKELKVNPLYRDIPVVILTSVAGATGYRFSQELDGYWMKTDEFLDKPVTSEKLLATIERLLQERGQVEK